MLTYAEICSFMYGHSVNHHRYNNGPGDVISTADMPRDSVAAWVSYVPRFFLYACNISTGMLTYAHVCCTEVS
jgi:hypothetical protein